MSSIDFVKGMSFGIIAGATIGIAMAPKNKRKKTMAGRALHTMGEIVENITDAIGM